MFGEWQPIETYDYPKDDYPSSNYKQVLVSNGEYIYLAFWNGRSWDDGDFHDDLGKMTHWMDCPELPREKSCGNT